VQNSPPVDSLSPTEQTLAAVLPESAPDAETPDLARQAAYTWFISGVGSWFTAFGMQGVLFSWLVVGVLQAEAEWVGIAQSALMLPSILLVLIGGMVADRSDGRSLLIWLHVVASVLSGSLVIIVANEWLSMAVLIGYALCMGSVQAFVMPARDSLLSEVAGTNMLRAVAGMTLTQWMSQALGALLAGSARWFGIVPALCMHSLILLAGAPTLRKLPPAPPQKKGQARANLSDILEGVHEVVQSPVLRPLLLLVTMVGIGFIGPYLVVLPILVRDYYGGDVAQLAALNMAFPLGTIFGAGTILWYGGMRRKGLAQVLALLGGACCVGVLSFGLPFWGALLTVGVWGTSASIFMSAGRTVFQEQARPSHRARVLSVYTLGFMGTTGLIGAPLAGVMVDWVGPLMTCTFASGVMIVAVLCVAVFTQVMQVE
jgi:MFS family permease